jgi:hypothetical protein
LFFVHLLIPHRPYIYRADGSTRDLREVGSQRGLWAFDTKEYDSLYREYGEQLQFLAGQLDAFLNGLKQTGLYDSTTVIIHGDHGSRIRLLDAKHGEHFERLRRETAGFNPLSRYDYVGDPDPADLLNRFGTLLAIKPPASASPEVVMEAGSVLYFLQQFFGSWGESKDPDALNAAYLFNADGSPHPIPMVHALRESMHKNLSHRGE